MADIHLRCYQKPSGQSVRIEIWKDDKFDVAFDASAEELDAMIGLLADNRAMLRDEVPKEVDQFIRASVILHPL